MLSFGILIVGILSLAYNFTKKSKNAPDRHIKAFLLISLDLGKSRLPYRSYSIADRRCYQHLRSFCIHSILFRINYIHVCCNCEQELYTDCISTIYCHCRTTCWPCP
ncbi:hypothetical protein [Bacillus glycinifermentans]|uniref:hypothetical protein n=1 Tax=Bacillus glycinifermentans TaxID=1664069 RepID=UPI003CCFE875